MKKSLPIVVLSASAAVFLPATTRAFTLATPAVIEPYKLECMITNVGRIDLKFYLELVAGNGDRYRLSEQWVELAPGGSMGLSYTGSPVPYDRCTIRVRAKNKLLTARKSMVRAGMTHTDADGEKIYVPLH